MAKLLTLAIHCACGTSFVGTTERPEMADELMRLFHRRHCGAGHAPVSSLEETTSTANPLLDLDRRMN